MKEPSAERIMKFTRSNTVDERMAIAKQLFLLFSERVQQLKAELEKPTTHPITLVLTSS